MFISKISAMVPSVIKREGLRSPKAIAFISSRLKPLTYFTVRKSAQKALKFLKKKSCVELSLNVCLKRNIGVSIWIK